MSTRVELQPALVLHTRPYRDTSAIVDVFSRDYGRLSIVARGMRRPKSPWRACLQPFRLVLISWQGKSELKTLLNVDLGDAPYPLSGKALMSGMYLNELIVRMTYQFQAQPSLFERYQVALAQLVRCDGQLLAIEGQLRSFEIFLLEALGYGLCFDREADGVSPVKEGAQYCFDSAHGFTQVEGEVSLDRAPRSFSGDSLLSIAQRCYDDPQVLKDAKRLMRLALAPHLGSKPLHSRQLFIKQS